MFASDEATRMSSVNDSVTVKGPLESPPRFCVNCDPYVAAADAFDPMAPYPDHCWREYGDTVNDDNMPWNLFTADWNTVLSVPGGGVGKVMFLVAAGLYP
jgi:hypothetical protein